MELQSEIARGRSELFLDSKVDVIVEEIDAEADEAWGRSYRDAPEVDGLVCVEGASSMKPGDVVRAKIHDCSENDLFGEVIP